MRVTPFVGVWIEINRCGAFLSASMSLPLWECGLKFINFYPERATRLVTPFVGVWIEIEDELGKIIKSACHSLCGSVDWNPQERY